MCATLLLSDDDLWFLSSIFSLTMRISWDFANCLGAGESGKSTIFKQASSLILYCYNLLGQSEVGLLTFLTFLLYFFLQIKLLFQTGFDEAELKSYIPVIHANVYQTIKVCNVWKGVLVISLSAWFREQMNLSKNFKP